MGIRRRSPTAAVAIAAALAGGCFGYNRSAKRWAYVGDAVLLAGGGGVIAADRLGSSGGAATTYEPPFSGVLVVGVVLAAAGLFGIVFNATRPIVKTSR